MIDPWEARQRTLGELEEAWSENIFTLLNTIYEPSGEHWELPVFRKALVNLIEHELVMIDLNTSEPRTRKELSRAESLALAGDLEAWCRFDLEGGFWTQKAGDWRTSPIPEVVLTSTGRIEAEKLLDKRGYQWWRPRKKI